MEQVLHLNVNQDIHHGMTIMFICCILIIIASFIDMWTKMDCGCVSKSVVGTELKFALSLSLPGSLTMDGVDFTARFYIYQGRSVDVPKAEMAKQDSDTYICVVDSSRLGSGGEVTSATLTEAES